MNHMSMHVQVGLTRATVVKMLVCAADLSLVGATFLSDEAEMAIVTRRRAECFGSLTVV